VAASRTRLDWAVAAFAFFAILAHDAAHVNAGRYWDVFWVCNVSAALVAPAIILQSSALSIAALTWLIPGTVVWLSDVLVAGSNILPTSYAVHLGGVLASAYAVRRAGYSRTGVVASLVVLAGSVAFSRAFLPAAANVNAAHAIPKGWGFLGSTRLGFAVAGTMLAGLSCAIGDMIARRIGRGGDTGSR
jgi:hypothetical protein